MLMGAMHFVLKAFYGPATGGGEYTSIFVTRKFLLPGSLFISFLCRYGNIENTLVPLNRISENDNAKGYNCHSWLAQLSILNERVIAFDVRHRDVVGSSQRQVGKAPTPQDVLTNILDNYSKAEVVWARRTHREWGLFRSMWPAAVLLSYRLDRNDP